MFTQIKRKKHLLWPILIIFALFFLVNEGKQRRASAVGDENYETLKILSQVLSIVQKNYVEEVKIKDLVYGAIKGMLEALDPHSGFMPPEAFKEVQLETKGKFGGLGIEITTKEGVLTVVSPIEDTPAFQAGIKAGDQIIKIGGYSTKNMTLIDAVKKMRGPAGTKITITIMREGFTEPKDFTLTRAIIKVKSVKSKLIEEEFGYVRIAQFQERTSEDFKSALDKLESKAKLKGLVLDLRNNPGGLLDQAVEVADEFIDSGLIVYTEGREGEIQSMKFNAHKNKQRRDYPLIILVNAGSASGSEIVAGALQDHGKALLLGTQTFGKGSVQTIMPLEDGSGLRLTTARYYTPKGRSIQAKGITPDIIVPDRKGNKEEKKEEQRFLREKDLEHRLLREGEKIEKEEAKEATEEEREEDPPLERAIQLLKSWKVFKITSSKESS